MPPHQAICQAVSRWRPLARRRLISWRPLLVAMRERKPWLRFRFNTLGWNVLFMIDSLRRSRGRWWSKNEREF